MRRYTYKLHGLPKHIISNRDVLFTSTFWTQLNKIIGTKLKMSSTYHPETNRSTECTNWTITQMLHNCVNAKQTNWINKLLNIEFAINSTQLESTGYALFFLNTGQMPWSMIWDSTDATKYPLLWNFTL